MTEAERTAWLLMLDALRRASVALPIGDGIMTVVEYAVDAAEKARPDLAAEAETNADT